MSGSSDLLRRTVEANYHKLVKDVIHARQWKKDRAWWQEQNKKNDKYRHFFSKKEWTDLSREANQLFSTIIQPELERAKNKYYEGSQTPQKVPMKPRGWLAEFGSLDADLDVAASNPYLVKIGAV